MKKTIITLLFLTLFSKMSEAEPQYEITLKTGQKITTHHYWKEKNNINCWVEKKEISIPSNDISTIKDNTPIINATPVTPKNNESANINPNTPDTYIIGKTRTSHYRTHNSTYRKHTFSGSLKSYIRKR